MGQQEMFNKKDRLAVDAIRILSIDAIQEANSGHPGLPMGAAPMAYALWSKHLRVNPNNVDWFNRDRFILSAGHGSAMLYSLLHLSGFDLPIEEIKNFRQLGSKTPGHPEVHETQGVETTTGPLGQGLANAVGFAMAEAHLAAKYNKPDYPIIDHYTYTLVGDGDLQEGISYEAVSLAGHLKLEKLIVLFDSNDIQLDGPTKKATSEDMKLRFESADWDYILVEEGMDLKAINEAIEQAKKTDKPTLIELKTTIGEGAPEAGTSTVHGAPLGDEGVEAARKSYGWESNDRFDIPEDVYTHFKDVVAKRGQDAENQWNELFNQFKEDYPEEAKELQQAIEGELPVSLDEILPSYSVEDGGNATRNISNEVINAVAGYVPSFWGGSADLSGSNKTTIKKSTDFSAEDYTGKNIWYGVREHAMASALNGITLHGGTKSFVSTFFVFTDYLRPAVRLAALSNIPATYVMTHDSIAVGEDGPTHEPIEQLASFRAMHNLNVLRPADANEVSGAWKVALESTDRPSMIVLTRQSVPVLPNTKEKALEYVSKGGYVLSPQEGDKPDGILIATGSEVQLAIEAQKLLQEQGKDVSVVSMPATNLFDEQSDEYRESVLPSDVKKRIAIEMGSSVGWHKYTGFEGEVIGIDKFGSSGPGDEVIEQYGFTVQNIVDIYKEL